MAASFPLQCLQLLVTHLTIILKGHRSGIIYQFKLIQHSFKTLLLLISYFRMPMKKEMKVKVSLLNFMLKTSAPESQCDAKNDETSTFCFRTTVAQ